MNTPNSNAPALFQQAYGLHQQGKIQQAKLLYEQIIAMAPETSDAYLLLGVIAQQTRDSALAIRYFETVIQQQPNFAVTYCHMGVAQKSLGLRDQALKSYDQAIALDPRLADAFYNRGILRAEMRQYEAALQDYDAAIAVRPHYPEAYCNRGIALRQLHRLEEALASYQQALTLKPNLVDALYNRGLCWLQLGDFAQGWPAYEWRWQCQGISASKNRREFVAPLWLGEQNLSGKTIYVYSEQGLGDTLQFCRYLTILKAMGASVILEVQAPLLSLLQHIEGLDQCMTRPAIYPPMDYQIPLMSLPLACETNQVTAIPAPAAYLYADPIKLANWQQRLGQLTGLKVGLVWSGSASHKNDQQRSIDLSQLLSSLPQQSDAIHYISLQKEYREADTVTLRAHPEVMDFAAELQDFSDTAALCQALDLVISVDTSVAHLAGGLGKPVLLLLPWIADWRWLDHRDDSPWYPSFHLMRQSRANDWDAVLAQLPTRLQQHLVLK
ncbi:tetratricopeptide repeat protein [Undibacterium fentianense]|uniref:Glycosyltransferase family protein n=1 Tax=Undibacterium fentianense TaxID=2828728 RepID=A0A941E186_9BURK|nr:tetratricopeptide repeat-containing glycosyltransferase family protein [Undibacterium fentianense]MBR7800510.1 glycosyltransferase family protein [Undibacterium fentianense]